MSRSPNTVMATVRGIGVAVMTRTCGRPSPALSRSASRCSTPNRCCSSMTTRPRSANWTCSSSRAWVPITMPASPEAASSSARRRAAAPIEPVSSVTRVACSAPPSWPAWPSGPSRAVIDRQCCWASTSVGASSAACPAASTACSMARTAMIVLPEPTSPWSSRFMGWSAASSAAISAPASCWPRVSSNGRVASKASSRPPGTRRPRDRGVVGRGPAALGQHDLQDERLVPLQALPRPVPVGVVDRAVDAAQRVGVARQPVLAPDRGRQRVGGHVQDVERDPHRVGDPPRGHLGRGRVDRDQLGRELGRPGPGRALPQQLVVGVGQLALAAEAGHLAREQAAHAGLELLLAPALVAAAEERQRQPAVPVGDDGLEDRAAPVAHRAGGHRGDLGHHGDVLALDAGRPGRSARRAGRTGAGSGRAGRRPCAGPGRCRASSRPCRR